MPMNHLIELRRLRKVVLPAGAGDVSDEAAATLCAEAEALGFTFSADLLAAFRRLDDARFASHARGVLRALRELKGAHRAHEPLYPGFPEEVMQATEAQLYLNALRHYYSGGRWRPHRIGERRAGWLERRPSDGVADEEGLAPVVLELGTREEFEAILAVLVEARSSPSEADRADMQWFVSQYRQDVQRLLPEAVGSKETLAVIAGALLMAAPDLGAEFVHRHAQTATDVLRIAAALSGGDVSLAEPVRFVSMPRSVRRLFAEKLEAAPNLLEDLYRRPERWKRLGERLHPGEFGTARPRLAAAFSELRSSTEKTTFAARVERALAHNDTTGALGLLAERPGELARRLDVLLRRHNSVGDVVAAFQRTAGQVSTPVLLQVEAHFDHASRPHPDFPAIRVFFPKGQTAKLWARPDLRSPQPAAVSDEVADVARETLRQRFAERPALGRVFVDPSLANFTVPLAQRSASRSFRTVARGSRLPIPDARIIRLFLWWKNGRDRTDIDLSATLFDDACSYVDVLSYYSLKSWGAVHSGDIVDAPQGAAEFIDLDTEILLQRGVRYVVMSLNSYTSQPYCDLPECFAGWMSRREAGSKEAFDPRTVVDRLDLTANTTICIPLIFDVSRREAVWTDLGLRRHPAYGNNVHNNLAGLATVVAAMTSLHLPTLHTLFSLHAAARGQPADEPANADTVFSPTDGITPFDADIIRAQFL
jgi:hypothetical protein